MAQQYHVAMQIESIAQKGKTIPARAALAETLFMAGLETDLLAAIHDLDALLLPITVDVATGHERYLRPDGVKESCKSGDMLMRDFFVTVEHLIACLAGSDGPIIITTAIVG